MLGNLRFKYTQCSFIKKNASNRHKKGFKGQKSSKAYEAQKRITGYMFCSRYLDLIVCLRIFFMPEVELYWKADHREVLWVETEIT